MISEIILLPMINMALSSWPTNISSLILTRVGIYGHSGGGFMSTAAIFSYPDFYKVAVSSSGNHDNNIYNQWWAETHNGI